MLKLKGLSAAAAPAAGGWNLANAAYNGSPVNWFYVGAQETAPTGIFFKPDGTKMYIVGQVGDDVNEYSLSSAWDVSTASYVQNFSVATEETNPTGIFFKSDGTKMYIVGSNGDDVNEYTLSTAWDITTASYVQNFSVATQETAPTGIFFKPDGTKMYIVGSAGDDVNEYSLSTAWDISTASYVQNFSVATEDTIPQDIFFKSDGTKMYIVGGAGDDVNEYSLSTAWDISTASYVQNFSVVTEDTGPTGIFFKDDGTKMYIVGETLDAIYQYNLSTAWDISTASFTYPANDYFSVATEETGPTGVSFKSDGTKMYIIGTVGDDVNEYSLSSAWDISTASYVQNFSVTTEDTAPAGLFFKPDGTKMYIVGTSGDAVWAYTLSSAWDISTASIPSYGKFSVFAQEAVPQDMFFKPDGTKMYVIGSNGDDVNEYTLSTAWDITTASYVQNFSVATQETSPQGIFFKDDGTKMYITGAVGDDVNEYSLSSAWDISTASYVQNFSVATEETSPQGIFFKDDGTKMYITGNTGDDVNEYSLSTAWDISTASYVQNFSVATEETNPTGIFFKSDGTRMYIVGSVSQDVNEYSLSTAWDVSTASYVQNFSVVTQASSPTGVSFKSDGTKMYIIDNTSDSVWSYTLSTAWDISTASWDAPTNAFFSVLAQDTTPLGISFKDDGTKMYIVGATEDAVNEYNLSTAWDISTASYLQNFSVVTELSGPNGIFFKNDGTEMYIIDSSKDAIFGYTLT